MTAAPPDPAAGGRGWRVWIDRGGTFTDLVAHDPAGQVHVAKVLSVQPGQRQDPAIRALACLLQRSPTDPLPPELVAEVRLGTTVATNALLERQLAPVLLLVNRGLADLLWIGDQRRPAIFSLKIERPQPLAVRVVELDARLAADGRELSPLILDRALQQMVDEARTAGVGSAAVALLHADRHPQHEQVLGRWLEQQGFRTVVLSHQVSGRLRLVPRLQTTVAEAALQPVLQAYLQGVQAQLGVGPRLRVITSSGALQAPESLQAKDTILSGPAGGLLGAVAAARAAGFADRPILGFDMGGTSTDVFHHDPDRTDGAWERREETEIDGLRLQAPMLAIHTVAAGGGSLLTLEGGRLLVGPRSAGADPGPACYRRGGPATLTDANLLLGRCPPEALPQVFGADGCQGADPAAARARFEALAAALALAHPDRPRPSVEALAHGARRLAIERMAEAIRRISIQRGHGVEQAVLVSYGGAGGQHACALADHLGIGTVLLHPLAGVLSAWGIGQAQPAVLQDTTLRLPLQPASWAPLQAAAVRLRQQAAARLDRGGDLASAGAEEACWSLEVRTPGSDQGLLVAWTPEAGGAGGLAQGGTSCPPSEAVAALEEAFRGQHRQRFGYSPEDPVLVVERLLLELRVPQPGCGAAWSGPEVLPAPAQLQEPMVSAAAEGPREPVASGPSLRSGGPRSVPPLPVAPLLPLWLPGPAGAEPEALQRQDVPCWRRQELSPGQELVGPALVLEPTGTTVLDPGWRGRVLAGGALVLEHGPSPRQVSGAVDRSTDPHGPAALAEPLAQPETAGHPARPGHTDRPVDRAGAAQGEGAATGKPAAAGPTPGPVLPPPDPVRLELYNHRFMAIAEQMGLRLQQTSRSVNIRERLDFSCALFDGRGRLVANAPHIPVHLGSMGQSVVALLAAVKRGAVAPLAPGDAVASNNPYNGGTHLPDITVISPVFVAGEPAPLFYVASRGHHADVGGITPGSMPPFSCSIDQEGLLLDQVPLIRQGVLDRQAWLARLAAGPTPVRNPEQLLADLQAQVAANQLGVQELQRLVQRQGLAEVRAYMAHGQAQGAAAVRRLIDQLQDGSHRLERDDGSCLAVQVRVDRQQRRLSLDFHGTSPQQPGNANAPLAITRAVVLYVMRSLTTEAIPLNDGCFEPIDLHVPEGSLLHPRPPAAVVAGNVETSQALADLLLGALGVQAGSQGTMNNLSFGDGDRQYYETIGGGSGAGCTVALGGFAGASAVQCHMTNSSLTDPELLEDRYPVRLWRFSRRHGSGGTGRWPGGDGVVRELEVLAPLTVALLSSCRRVAPAGLAGGADGCTGRNSVQRAGGAWEPLPGNVALELQPGDRLRIETPGGGGYGAAEAPFRPPAQRER